MSLFSKFFGPKKPRWSRPENSLDKHQVSTEQRIAVEACEVWLKKACDSREWQFEDFEGPYIVPDDQRVAGFMADLKVQEGLRGDYDLWLIEVGNAKGHFQGVGDNQGKFRLIVDGYHG